MLAATFDHLGVPTGVDVGGVLAAAEEVVRPFLPRWPKMDRSAIVQGWAGVYSSFLLHAERAAERYGVPAHEILQRAGELGYVGGQEDMIIDIAVRLAQERTWPGRRAVDRFRGNACHFIVTDRYGPAGRPGPPRRSFSALAFSRLSIAGSRGSP